ncbi:bifunctional riboflavin kinase/FAD synthetase [Ktedonosporobacter rubrisoli]|uniref:Riboflavin biosynthesis protein n=1 Tax=Ktedonosporobacter rubrisoli TaxID=2509675 RepID=A0A4P6K1F4_KTERU|nr:bifunctional riboflavin kinase/FAD synthetase [Ktedonosporobacter rubrisoli]QBD81997.1 bifunctional riboflavin kinase/FAD synthetase [Ktedonosporobacter rubrisoli]
MQYQTTLSPDEPIVITIGNFDGIHKGHQRLMHELHVMAEALHCLPVVVTFQPHTLMVVRPEIYVQYLTTLEEKLALASKYGQIARSIVISFTPQVSAMSAQEFMDTLCKDFQIRGLVVGANFSLGRNRMGDTTFLEQYGQEHNIQVRIISLEESEQVRISSTRIRALVTDGHIEDANELLGHPVVINGIVRHGDERGRLLGFPTANLHPDPHKLLPANGVYAVRVRIKDQEEVGSDSNNAPTVYNGVANIGVRPTFNGKERLVEVHLLDVNLDLYEKRLSVDFIARLRNEQRFSGIDALKTQIASDVERARQILAIGG